MEKPTLYDFLIKTQSIARIGLTFSRDPYALENYRELNELTFRMLENLQDVDLHRNNYFARDVYPTPNISNRTIILNDRNEILMVKEAKTGNWSIPGGWCDLYDAPSRAAEKEVSEEAGADVEIIRLLGLLHRTPFKAKGSVPEYVAVFLGKMKGHFHKRTNETEDAGFFPITALPPLSRKLSRTEIDKLIDAALTGRTLFD